LEALGAKRNVKSVSGAWVAVNARNAGHLSWLESLGKRLVQLLLSAGFQPAPKERQFWQSGNFGRCRQDGGAPRRDSSLADANSLRERHGG